MKPSNVAATSLPDLTDKYGVNTNNQTVINPNDVTWVDLTNWQPPTTSTGSQNIGNTSGSSLIDSIVNYFGGNIAAFFGNQNGMKMYVGGDDDPTHTFTGYIYNVGIATSFNTTQIANHFDENGICDACRTAEIKDSIDWGMREEELKELLDKHRKNDTLSIIWRARHVISPDTDY